VDLGLKMWIPGFGFGTTYALLVCMRSYPKANQADALESRIQNHPGTNGTVLTIRSRNRHQVRVMSSHPDRLLIALDFAARLMLPRSICSKIENGEFTVIY